MTTEELGAIRKWALGPGPHNVYQLEKDVRALRDEVDRLRYMLRTIHRLTDLRVGAETRLIEIREMVDQV